MNKLLVASVACLLSVSMSSLVRAEEKLAAQDPFGEYEEAKVVTEKMEMEEDPFGNAESRRAGGMPMLRGRGRGTGMGSGEFGMGEIPIGQPRTFTIVSGGDMQLLLDTRDGKSWLLSNLAGGTKWVEVEKVQTAAHPTNDAEKLGQKEAGRRTQSTTTYQRDALGLLRERYASLVEKNKELEDKVVAYRDGISSLNDKNTELRSALETRKTKESDLVKQFNALSDERAELQLEITNLNIYVTELKKELKESKDKAYALPQSTVSETPAPAKNE